MEGYLATCADASFIPISSESRNTLFRALLLDRLLLETSHALQSRPLWLGIPLEGLLETLGEPE